MIKTMLHNIKTGETRWGDESLFTEWSTNPDLWLWADFYNTDQQHEKDVFIDTFNLRCEVDGVITKGKAPTSLPKPRRRQELGKKGSFSKVSMSDELVKN